MLFVTSRNSSIKVAIVKTGLATGLLAGVLLVGACAEAPKPVSGASSPQPASGGYGSQPQSAQPATVPSAQANEPLPELPPVPDSIQKLEKQYEAKPGDAKLKAELVKAKLDYGNELMFKSPLPPRVKYRAALKMYREVLALDPSNKEAEDNKGQIEAIYKSMNRPVPTT
ncbi:MAG TPA: hypothetical protein PKE58_09605 [Acidobacteriota bacterium]|nr:hypothetical protein [Acidobacteriota bacterium]